MNAVVRRLHSPDVDLTTYVPDDPEDVGVLVQIMAGSKGKPGEELFDVVVCTPRWLDRRIREDGPLVGRHYLIVERWDLARVRLYLTDAVGSEEGATWRELALRIGRIGMWEFEDYHSS